MTSPLHFIHHKEVYLVPVITSPSASYRQLMD